MTKTTKLIIGVGAIALAYYLFKDKFKKTTSATSGGQSPLPTSDGKCPSGFKFVPYNCVKAPCNGGDCVPMDSLPPKSEPRTQVTDYSYVLNQYFTQRFPIGASASGGITFKKGQQIEATTNPYVRNSSLYTTTQGKLPNFNAIGEKWIEVPSNILTKLK